MSRIVFVDTEVSTESGKVCNFGAVNAENEKLHTKSEKEFADFIRKGIFPFGDKFICGHNILAHDLQYIEEAVDRSGIKYIIDTLYLSPLLFPNKPYHALLKDDKLRTDELILKLRSGMKMLVTQSGMNIVTKDGQREMLRFSKAFKGQLSDLAGRGYTPYKGEIRFITAWTDKDDNTECAVVLPDIYLRRS